MGVGLLPKQFCLRVGTMGIGGLAAQDLRARFSRPQILIRIVVIVVMIIPHQYWF